MPSRSVQILYNKIEILQKPINNYKIKVKSSKIPSSLEDLILSTQRMPSIKIIMNFSQNWWDISHTNKK